MSSDPSSSATLPSPSSAGLCPGYRHVEEFDPDEEYEDEIEEFYVTLDVGSVEPTLIPSSSTYRLIGLDTPTPFMQLSGTVLQGRHESLLGTELIFSEGKDAEDRSKRRLSFTSITEKRIRFREVQLRPKVPPGEDQARPDVIDAQVAESNNANSSTSNTAHLKEPGAAPRRRRSKKNPDHTKAGYAGASRKTTRKSEPSMTKDKGKGKAKEILDEEGRQEDVNDPGSSMDVDT
ncbi:hypothetical protein F5878DRAFT_23397 [Lentinula raphanica]|uniref:Transcription factor TFIIIC triple barrel domain-containing protein n=1 Tax=Lentinula raphanica TaxID=153919 RepID=A0AA38UGS8_9AGAR|nr:hypothetical protein F5880DRAFT_366690 [Lentinula raphanica]KAJ3841272.1 hypothetical protein F5878DRAFT_23397 [Lentinula raphanica]